MKGIVWLILLMLAGCALAPSNKDSSDSSDKSENIQTEKELDSMLDSLTAEGEYCLVRGSDREYDTIIDHIRYRYVKEEGYDTPRDNVKHLMNE